MKNAKRIEELQSEVMRLNGMTKPQAIEWLNEWTPGWELPR